MAAWWSAGHEVLGGRVLLLLDAGALHRVGVRGLVLHGQAHRALVGEDVDRDDQSARFWLAPVALARNIGFTAVELRHIQRLIEEHEHRLIVDLLDGRTISVPLAWYPRLLSATPEQRANWRMAGGGFGIHWLDIDEDLSTEGMLRGSPAPRSP